MRKQYKERRIENAAVLIMSLITVAAVLVGLAYAVQEFQGVLDQLNATFAQAGQSFSACN